MTDPKRKSKASPPRPGRPSNESKAIRPSDHPLKVPATGAHRGGGQPKWDIDRVADIVAQRLIGGASSLREACNAPWTDPDTGESWPLPSADTLRRLVWEHPEANHRVFEARTAAVLHQLDALQEAMDDASNDFAICPVTGKLVPNTAAVRRLDLKTRHVHYMLSKLLPQFQDRYQVEHRGNVEVRDQRLADILGEGLAPLHRIKWDPEKAAAYERWCEQRGLAVGNHLQAFDEIWKARVENVIEGEYQEVSIDRGRDDEDDTDDARQPPPRRAVSQELPGSPRDEEAVPSKAAATTQPAARPIKPRRQQPDLSDYGGRAKPMSRDAMPDPEGDY